MLKLELIEHEDFIRESFKVAESAISKKNDPFGAVLVKDNKIVMIGENTIYSENDIGGHAETNCIRKAYKKYGPEIFLDATIYANGEPCVMCCGLIYWSGIKRLVYSVPTKYQIDFMGGGINLTSTEILTNRDRKIEVIGGVLFDEGFALLKKCYQEVKHSGK